MNIISKILKPLTTHQRLVKKLSMLLVVTILLASIGVGVRYRKLYEAEVSSVAAESQNNAELVEKNTQLSNNISSLKDEISSLVNEINELEQKNAEQQETIDALLAEIDRVKEENSKLLKNAACSVTTPDKEFLQARFIWNYLKQEMLLNDYVAAGIMGNLMVEVGGQTLDFSRHSCKESQGGKYYGICQWAGSRKERLLKDFGGSIEDQCRFLHVELYEVIPATNDFYSMQDEKEAALYFAKKFERCSSRSYEKRQNCATKALEFFVTDKS